MWYALISVFIFSAYVVSCKRWKHNGDRLGTDNVNSAASDSTVSAQCSAAIEFFVIGPEGKLRTCEHSPVQLNGIGDIENAKHHPY